MTADGSDGSGLAPRRAALRAIEDVEVRGAWSTIAVPDRVSDLIDSRDRALASHLAYDTIRWASSLDWALAFASKRAPEEIEPDLLRILRMGALQLLRTRVPARAVVDTSATLAGQAVPRGRAKGASGFVNGVLRGLNRQLQSNALAWPEGDDPDAMAIATAHPRWLVDDAIARFGDEARSILDADNVPPGLTLRSNGDRDALVKELVALGFDASPHPLADEAVRAPGGDPRRLACVIEGRAVPQDAASMLVTSALDPQPGDRVLDLCAGPGGKTTHVAKLVGASGIVDAIELHEHRARLVSEAALAQGLANVHVEVGDGRELAGEPTHDRVLVDAPCTGLGIGRRRPEVRWRRMATDARDLAALQVELLTAAADRVVPGGRLTYAVCTWTLAETQGVVTDPAIVARLAGWELVGSQQLRPDVDDTDAMFIASWQRPTV